MRAFVAGLGLALVGCSATSATTPTQPDLALPAACATGQLPLSEFTSGNPFGHCWGDYAAARAAVDCKHYGFDVAACGSVDVLQYGSVASTVDCYYDHATGALVAAWGFIDTAGACAAGTAHDTCTPATWTSLCGPDGGM